ncbi:hypothetical protein QBC42DRAFT_283521 [Cladorrhinum samala]|uniref:Uncharacterized protein n=1 Tax=Cladorrhinum samala TaxID=585594 RepID=A0AAV9HXF2_9PEZI|nr:hypothetical protein QBC42DRAFT_283521 [Cladorrhinum samala]
MPAALLPATISVFQKSPTVITPPTSSTSSPAALFFCDPDAMADSPLIKLSPSSPMGASSSRAFNIPIRGMAAAANTLGLAPVPHLYSIPTTKFSAFSVPIKPDQSASATILAGPPLIDKTPLPFAHLLGPLEYSSIPSMQQKLSLLRAKLGQEELNLAALKAQGAMGYLINSVQNSTKFLKRKISQSEDRLTKKTARRDARIAQLRRILPARDSAIKTEDGATATPAPPGHWYDTEQRQFVPLRTPSRLEQKPQDLAKPSKLRGRPGLPPMGSRRYPDTYRPTYQTSSNVRHVLENRAPVDGQAQNRGNPNCDLIWDMMPAGRPLGEVSSNAYRASKYTSPAATPHASSYLDLNPRSNTGQGIKMPFAEVITPDYYSVQDREVTELPDDGPGRAGHQVALSLQGEVADYWW